MIGEKAGKIGAWAALLCGIHCMAMPLLVTVLPMLGLGFLMTGWAEIGLLAAATILSTLSLCWGFRQHRHLLPAGFLLSGLMWFFIAHFYRHSFWFSLAGGVCFLVSSIVNKKLCKSCSHCEAPP